MNPKPGSDELVEPVGRVDPEVSVLAIKSASGRPLALLANYSMHYCGDVGGDGIISADYFGAFSDLITRHLGTNSPTHTFVAMLSNGTSGDCNSTDFRRTKPPEPPYTQINRVAEGLAEDVVAIWKEMEFRTNIFLKSAQMEINLPVRKATPEELAAARTRLGKAKHRPDGQFEPWTRDIYDREAVLLSEYPDQMPLILQAFRIGDLAIAAIPCEVFAEIGLRLKSQSPIKPMFTIELANGYNGYLPTPEQHRLGGYETWRARSSYLATDASEKITAAMLELLASLK
jgi:hypothetical protein